MASKFRQIAARLMAVRCQLRGLQGEAHAANSKIQAAALKSMLGGIPQAAISHEERAQLGGICCGINWLSVDSEIVLVALAPHDCAIGAARKTKLQDFRNDCYFYNSVEWEYLLNPKVAPQSKMDCMLTKRLILGCRHPDEHTKKLWASLYLLLTRDIDSLSQVPLDERKTVKRHIAKSFEQRVKNFPSAGIGDLPQDPAAFKEQHPELFGKVFPDDSVGPIEPRINMEMLNFFDSTWKCRGGNGNDLKYPFQLESGSTACSAMKEVAGMFMNTVQAMHGNQQIVFEKFPGPHSCPPGLKSIQSLAALADKSALHRQSALEQQSSPAALADGSALHQQSPLEQRSFFPALADRAAPHQQLHLQSSVLIESQHDSQEAMPLMVGNAPEPPMRTHVNYRPAASADATVAPGAMVASGAIVAASSAASTVPVSPTTMLYRQKMMLDALDEREDEREEIRKQKQKEKREADKAIKAAAKATEKAELQRQKEAATEAAKAKRAAEKPTPKPLVDRAAGAAVPEGVQSAGGRGRKRTNPNDAAVDTPPKRAAAEKGTPKPLVDQAAAAAVQSVGGRGRKMKKPDDAAADTPPKAAKTKKACISHEASREQYLVRSGVSGIGSKAFSYKSGIATQEEAHKAAKDTLLLLFIFFVVPHLFLYIYCKNKGGFRKADGSGQVM